MTSEIRPYNEKPLTKVEEQSGKAVTDHASLKYSLLGPSLTKAGQDSVDQSKVYMHSSTDPSKLTRS